MEYPILCLTGEVLYSVLCSEIKYDLLLLCFSGGDVVFIALSVEVRLTLGVNAFSITNFNLRCFVNLLFGSCS
jgi:hypothetical protein